MTLSAAYSATGSAWRDGPERIYQRLADLLVARSPVSVAGSLVADVGAGTGAASRAIRRAGGLPVALDVAAGMLAVDRRDRPPPVVADARRLPLASGSCRAVVAAFSFNHVPDPDLALVEAARVVSPPGAVLASAYAEDDAHPVKAAVEAAATERGWVPGAWVEPLKAVSIPRLATVAAAADVVAAAGLTASIERLEVPYPDVGARDLVAWRMGMAQTAPFLASIPEADRRRVEARALDLLGDAPMLVRRIILIVASV